MYDGCGKQLGATRQLLILSFTSFLAGEQLHRWRRCSHPLLFRNISKMELPCLLGVMQVP